MAGDWFDQQQPYMDGTGGDYAPEAGQARQRTPVNVPDLTAQPGRTMPGGPPPAGSGGTQPYSDQALQGILHRYPATNDGMRAAMQEVDRTFGPGVVQLLDHPERLDKLVLPDGRTIDSIRGAGAPGAEWTWITEGAGGHSAPGGGGGVGTVGGLLGDPMAGKSITDDPSYQFRFKEGMQALERSAASRGTLLTGGMMKRLVGYGQDLASTEYQNSYARRASEQGNAYNRLYGVANMGLGATGNAAALGSSYANNQGNLLTQQGNAQAAGTIGQGNAWNNALGTVANIGQQYYQGRPTADANNTGNWIDQGRGLY